MVVQECPLSIPCANAGDVDKDITPATKIRTNPIQARSASEWIPGATIDPLAGASGSYPGHPLAGASGSYVTFFLPG